MINSKRRFNPLALTKEKNLVLHVHTDHVSFTFPMNKKSPEEILKRLFCNLPRFWVGEVREEWHNFYQYKGNILYSNVCVGDYAYGGNNSTVLITLKGKAFDIIYSQGEEISLRFIRWLKIAIDYLKGKITRLDLACDDYTGTYSVDFAKDAYDNHQFRLRSKSPTRKGYDGYGEGDTFYVGHRESKIIRIYEKGLQMKSDNKEWVRWELTLNSSVLIIPTAVLLNPGAAFRNAYPVTKSMPINVGPFNPAERIRYHHKTTDTSVLRLGQCLKNSYGGLINFWYEGGATADEIVDAIRQTDRYPPRLRHLSGQQEAVQRATKNSLCRLSLTPLKPRSLSSGR